MHTVSAFFPQLFSIAVAGKDAILIAQASNCLHTPQPVKPPPAAVMDTDRNIRVASHTPSDPAAATNGIAAPARMTHPTEPEGDSTIADMQTDQSTHGSAKPPSGTNGELLGTNGELSGTNRESQSAAGTVACDSAAAAAPAQSTATAANAVTWAHTDAVPHHHNTGIATDAVLNVCMSQNQTQHRNPVLVPQFLVLC